MKKLPSSTIRRLRTDTVVVDVHSAVKELIENALDAGATRIDVRLEGGGLKSVEVRDNGVGIPRAEVALAVAPYYTSRLQDFAALETLQSYGFRGEALHSICNNCGELSIMTRTASDDSGLVTTFDHKGLALSAKPTAMESTGTAVIVKELFRNTPVRLQVARNRSKEEMRRLTQTMWAYAIVRPDVHFTLRALPQVDFVKPPLPSTAAAIKFLCTDKVFAQLEEVRGEVDGVASFEGFLPRGNSLVDLSTRPSNDRCFIFVNHRPVDVPQIARLVNKSMRQHFFGENGDRRVQRRFAFIVLHLNMTPSKYDVNCSPDKRQIMLHAIDPILEQLRTVLLRLYPAQGAPGFAASEAFASYAASPTKVKVTLVNPTTRATTQVSLAQLAGAPRFTDHPAAAGLDTTTDDGEPDEPSSLVEHREGGIDDDTEPPTQTYGHPPANSTPGIQYAPAAQAHEREHEAEHHQGGGGEEEEEEEGEEAHTQVYGGRGGGRGAGAGASGGGAPSRQPEFGGGHSTPLVSPRFRSPVVAAQPAATAAAAASSYPRVAPAPTRVASLDTGGALPPGGADLSPYTSFLASIDPVRAAQLPPAATAKRKLDRLPHDNHHHHHDDDENEAEDEPCGDIRRVGNDGEASRRAAKALKTERSSNSGPGRELRVTVGVEDLSQRIAATQLAATQRMARSPSGSSPDVRLVGVAGLDGPPERGGSTLIVSVGDRLLALCPSLAEKALQQQHAQPREAAGVSHVPGRPNLTREAGELLLARLRSARLLGDLGTAMPVWCSPLAGGPPSRSREHHQ